jgi:glutaredoxin 2
MSALLSRNKKTIFSLIIHLSYTKKHSLDHFTVMDNDKSFLKKKKKIVGSFERLFEDQK